MTDTFKHCVYFKCCWGKYRVEAIHEYLSAFPYPKLSLVVVGKKKNIWVLSIYQAMHTFIQQENGLRIKIFWFRIQCLFHETVLLHLTQKLWCWWSAEILDLEQWQIDGFSFVSMALLCCAWDMLWHFQNV